MTSTIEFTIHTEYKKLEAIWKNLNALNKKPTIFQSYELYEAWLATATNQTILFFLCRDGANRLELFQLYIAI